MKSFKAPEGMELPADIKEGQEFDALSTLRMGKDGKIELIAVDGHPLDEAEKEDNPAEEREEAPEDADFAATVADKMRR